eukprot:CAMPEP_0197074478 /NCGR_PEP_ID=MMETSP1384-20130603/211128_1 /TAXON_ID=29189 /ORGANISM="Ammonia sp." /LENGTH=575 /DNA_ID=CAMNT_0042513319 /DNA_START=21 /DNA_END=1748 /DNA_ORIENTATION=+
MRKAVKAIKDGTYPPRQGPTDEELQKQIALAALKQSRQGLKGLVHRQPDTEASPDQPTLNALFIGQTGAGKTTLINSMTNYLHRVGYDEPFRYKLIMEEKDASIDTKDTTKSQTREITKYHLREIDLPAFGFALNIYDTPGFGDTEGPEQDKKIRGEFREFFETFGFALNIYDTPGFGDTEGPEQDKKIRAEFREFFENEDRIDAIYFVIKSSATRLTPIQQYIFNMVLDLFGHDVKNNIFLVFTFSDGAKPPALEAVKKLKIPFADYYQINNSGFGLPETGHTNRVHQTFFDLGTKQFDVIFDALAKVQPASTKLSRETLRERENVSSWLHRIGEDAQSALRDIGAMNKTYCIWQRQQEAMRANEDYQIPEQQTKVRRDPLPSSQRSLCCNVCMSTCQANCSVSDSQIYGSTVMKDGYCTACPMKCKWNQHTKQSYVIRRDTVTVYKANTKMAEKYNAAKQRAVECEELMRGLLASVDRTERQSRGCVEKIKSSVERLRKIALHQNVLTGDTYFATLIQTERDEAKLGWQARVQRWENMRMQNNLLREVVHGQCAGAVKWAQNANLKKYREQFN